jgi:hypothetical protein
MVGQPLKQPRAEPWGVTTPQATTCRTMGCHNPPTFARLWNTQSIPRPPTFPAPRGSHPRQETVVSSDTTCNNPTNTTPILSPLSHCGRPTVWGFDGPETSQMVTHPRIAPTRARLTLEIFYDPKPSELKRPRCLYLQDNSVYSFVKARPLSEEDHPLGQPQCRTLGCHNPPTLGQSRPRLWNIQPKTSDVPCPS